jgi:biopolymer transport protein ExbB
VSTALIIERFYQLRPVRVLPGSLAEELIAKIDAGRPSSIDTEQLRSGSPLGAILAATLNAFSSAPKSHESELRQSIELEGRLIVHDLERYMSALATIASAAPLLGLFGTVVGMIDIFGSQTGSTNNPALLAHGISTALYNTAFGLMIAIPTLIFWRYFRSQIDFFVLSLESQSEKLLHHLIQSR